MKAKDMPPGSKIRVYGQVFRVREVKNSWLKGCVNLVVGPNQAEDVFILKRNQKLQLVNDIYEIAQ